jgi:hypothetical protein
MAVATFSLMSICIDFELQDITLTQPVADNKGMHTRLLGKQTWGKKIQKKKIKFHTICRLL